MWLQISDVPWGVYVLVALSPLICFFTEVGVYTKYIEWRRNYQLQLKLEFDTKLGMYSPVMSPAGT